MLLSNVLGWPPKPLVIFCLRPGVPNKSDPVASYPEYPTSLGLYFDIFLGCYSIIRPHGASYIIFIYNIIWATVKMVENYFSIAGVFCQRFAQNTVKWWPPPKAITWDHTQQSIKLGVNQANTVVHIQNRPGKTDEGNSTCRALFPAVTIAFGIQLFLSFFLSLSLSVCRLANFLRTMS